jgi:hypothetical protein
MSGFPLDRVAHRCYDSEHVFAATTSFPGQECTMPTLSLQRDFYRFAGQVAHRHGAKHTPPVGQDDDAPFSPVSPTVFI